MESFFELAFPDVNFDLTNDTHVCCPFPHEDELGNTYLEHNPSMSINVDKGIYHCFVCGAKGTETNFIAQYMEISLSEAAKLKGILDRSNETRFDWARLEDNLRNNSHIVEKIQNELKFSNSAIKKLNIGIQGVGKGISFPVFLFDRLIDIVTYNPSQTPKYLKRKNSPNGIVMPYESWKENKKRTIIVAGQKDLGIALTHNLNAIAITGGEGTLPTYFVRDFKDRNVSIIYDNDNAGRKGAIKLALFLSPLVKDLNIVDISGTCIEKGEDLWDYFVKYGKSKKDLVSLIKETPPFSEKDYETELEKEHPTISLAEAVKPENRNKMLRSNIQVITSNSESFLMDSAIEAVKIDEGTKEQYNKYSKGDTITWEYTSNKPEQLFYLIDGSLKEHQIYKNKLYIMGLISEEYIKLNVLNKTPVFKATVSDYFESSNLEDTVSEYEVYCMNYRLESGKKYRITYKLVPHPLQGNKLFLVVYNVEDAQDSVTNFKLTYDKKEILKQFQVHNTLKETIDTHIERIKGIVNADLNSTLLKLIDFWYNTPLKFSLAGTDRVYRSYLDTLIVAESRVGKSSSAQALQKTYNLGTRIPLNGSNATIAGIVGGSQAVGKNGYQIRAGAIPRAHKGAIIFEELMKAKQDIQKELTEIRSSNQAIITRVSGDITLPAFVRMLTLTNARTDPSGQPKPINAYPNGIEVVVELVGTPEDIARYDIICVLPEHGAKNIDPFFKPLEPFSKDYYQTRIRWIWSRSAEQVSITKEIYNYAIVKSNELNNKYDSYIKIFGPETWMKLTRLAIAIAGYVVSTDEHFENIIVTKEHIDYAAELMASLYDNDTFRLKEYVDQEREFITVHDKDIVDLEKIWKNNAPILDYLQNNSRVTAKTLSSVSGLDNSEFQNVLSQLVSHRFVRVTSTEIIPSVKFRNAIRKIKKDISISTVSIK